MPSDVADAEPMRAVAQSAQVDIAMARAWARVPWPAGLLPLNVLAGPRLSEEGAGIDAGGGYSSH